MRTRQNGVTKLRIGILRSGIAVFFGCLVFLSGIPLQGQDQLLKEYIYLEGRLLAVERQPTPAIAQQPATPEEKVLKAGLPFDGDYLSLPDYTPEIPLSHSRESLADSVVLEQCPGAPLSSPACATE